MFLLEIQEAKINFPKSPKLNDPCHKSIPGNLSKWLAMTLDALYEERKLVNILLVRLSGIGSASSGAGNL